MIPVSDVKLMMSMKKELSLSMMNEGVPPQNGMPRSTIFGVLFCQASIAQAEVIIVIITWRTMLKGTLFFFGKIKIPIDESTAILNKRISVINF